MPQWKSLVRFVKKKPIDVADIGDGGFKRNTPFINMF